MSEIKTGDTVRIKDTVSFSGSLARYLTGRTGTVQEVGQEEHGKRKVRVLWGKRNNQGKEKAMWVFDYYLKVVNCG